ncbi:hypothetical protein HYS54_01205 [Candidatus Micrarchaeota archaeon]|nr:hypothetical protein [Candidatus Micrarchaeota archaeon]
MHLLFPAGLRRKVVAAEVAQESVGPLREMISRTAAGSDVFRHWAGASSSHVVALAPEIRSHFEEKLRRLSELDEGNRTLRRQLLARITLLLRSPKLLKSELPHLRKEVQVLLERDRSAVLGVRDVASQVMDQRKQAEIDPRVLEQIESMRRRLQQEREQE